jgi:hypothetical protein
MSVVQEKPEVKAGKSVFGILHPGVHDHHHHHHHVVVSNQS